MDTSCPRTVLIVLLACLFVVPSPAMSEAPEAGAAGSADSGRGEFVQAEAAELEFDNLTYSNSSLSFSLPTNSTIYSASVDLEGRPVVGPLVNIPLDFGGDTANMAGFSGTTTKNNPGTGKPATFMGNQMQGGDIGRISCQDSSCAEQWAYGYYGEFGYHHFKLKVPLDIIVNFTVSWTGYAGYYYYGYGSADAYLWNNVSLAWELIGTSSGGLRTVTRTFANGTDYVDWSKNVHILAICRSGSTYYGWTYNNIDTDYVKVIARGNVLTYPKNPSMDRGANGRLEWTATTDKFDYMVNVGDSTLANELQSLVKNSPGRYKPISIRFKSDSIGRIAVTNFTVAYNAPPWCKGIPDTFTLEEDTPVARLVNLSRYFEDDQPNIRYEVTYEEDSKLLDASVGADSQSLDFKLPTRNWWGTMGFRVTATDPEEKPISRESNTFHVTVNPVNDPPVLNFISKQVATQDKPFRLVASAKDPDCELDPTEKVKLADNCSLFDIDPSTGVINFTPRQDQVGTYYVQVTATDNAGARDSKNFTLEVLDAQDPPAISPIPDQTAVQDQPFSLKVTATDPDIAYGDGLTFSDDSPLFQIAPDTGVIQFVPTMKELGVHRVSITVTDHGQMTARRTFNLTVYNQIGNFDRPPSAERVENQTTMEGARVSFEVKAWDADGGDVLTFSDDSPVFDIDPATGKVDFTPDRDDAGKHWVTITVRDQDGMSANISFWLTIEKVNHPPQVSAVMPEDGTSVLLGGSLQFTANASDPDGDELNYTWMDGPTVVGYGPSVNIEFKELATYLITLTVSDGLLSVDNETMVIVEMQKTGGGAVNQKKNPLPGFAFLVAIGAVGVALVAMAANRRTGR